MLTDRDRAIAEEIAQLTTARLLAAAVNPDVAENVIDTWGGHLQKVVGKAVLRMLLYVLLGAIAIGSFKLGLTDKLLEFLRK